MKEELKLVQYERKPGKKFDLEFMSLENAKKVHSFHASFPMYEKTPLTEFPATAKELGLGRVYVKDESYRFGLNAFKVLGGSYAIGSYLAEKLGKTIAEMPYAELVSEKTKEELGEVTFVTATDGNHGRGVAWTANKLRQKAVVYMPKGSAKERLDNILAEGAEASITDLNYDEAVRLANSQAEEKGWVMVQDTAWEGYEDIPAWIMQGYGTMGYEAYTQLPEKPTHIFLQAGVGSMAGAITGFFSHLYGEDRPVITIVERTVCSALPKQRTALSTLSQGIWTPLWQGWPAESLAASAGMCFGIMGITLFPARTIWRLWECGSWEIQERAIPGLSRERAERQPMDVWRRLCESLNFPRSGKSWD